MFDNYLDVAVLGFNRIVEGIMWFVLTLIAGLVMIALSPFWLVDKMAQRFFDDRP